MPWGLEGLNSFQEQEGFRCLVCLCHNQSVAVAAAAVPATSFGTAV